MDKKTLVFYINTIGSGGDIWHSHVDIGKTKEILGYERRKKVFDLT